MNLSYYLKIKIEENKLDEIAKEQGLYEDIEDKLLAEFFAIAHHEINRLFMYLNSKLRSGHYNADESRQLIIWIKTIEDSIHISKESETPIYIDESYSEFFKVCKEFLLESGGSPIPIDVERIDIIEYDPIFSISDRLVIKNSAKMIKAPLQNIGEGSYAHVFKFYDEFYTKIFVLKRAKKALNEKELIRFRREFEIMKLLESPYIIEVFCYLDKTNEYIMEYADQTIYDYISKNNDTIELPDRISLVNQVLRGFKYIHSKGYLHRDISLKNILIKKYDGLNIIKISDFGLVKTTESTLTSFETEFKGSLNDPSLEIIGFENYSLIHETYALTRLIFFIMTGRMNLNGVTIKKIKNFIVKGMSDTSERYQTLEELEKNFREAFL